MEGTIEPRNIYQFCQTVTRMSRCWWFTEDGKTGQARWEWRLLRDDGTGERESREFASYGEAVRDAIVHGFRPTEDHWAIESTHLVTRYENGQQCEVLAKTGKQRGTPSGIRTREE